MFSVAQSKEESLDGGAHLGTKALAHINDSVGRLADAADEITDPEYADAIRTIPRWHFSMLNDIERNDAFSATLDRVVSPGAHVLDIGSGTGLLAMMAAKAGAGHVFTCEENPLLAELARQIVARHGLSAVVTVIPKRSTDLRVGIDLPRPADLIISEVVDCGLIGEGVLPTIRHARCHLLAPGGTLVPQSARIMGALVDSIAIDRLNRVGSAGGFEVSLFNKVATRGHFPVRLHTWPHRWLSKPTELVGFDFAGDALADGHVETEFRVSSSGQAHMMVAWFEMTLTNGITLRNSPDNLASHWMQACIPFEMPLCVESGESVRVQFSWQLGKLSVQCQGATRLGKELS